MKAELPRRNVPPLQLSRDSIRISSPPIRTIQDAGSTG